jgi:hypothetical protein
VIFSNPKPQTALRQPQEALMPFLFPQELGWVASPGSPERMPPECGKA